MKEVGKQDNDDDGVGGRDMGPSERLGRAGFICQISARPIRAVRERLEPVFLHVICLGTNFKVQTGSHFKAMTK